jgi:hypothetical protein
MLPVLTDVGASIYSVTQVMAVLNEQFKALATGDFKSLKTPGEIYNQALMAAAQGYIRFYGQTMIGRASRMMEEDPVLGAGNRAAAETVQQESQQQTRSLKAIEANTRQMVDLQRSILGGGNLGAMGVTPVELSNMRNGRGGSAEEMIAAGVRRAVMELMGPLQARRGF